MIEDKLDRSERIRLEALAQSIAFNNSQRPVGANVIASDKIIRDAKVFARWINIETTDG